MAQFPIQAAGGVVTRETPDGLEILLIHRGRYGDWCLPKGKLKKGENVKQAAAREVREETGYEVELGPELGELRYPVKGVPKVVRYWAMRARGQSLGIADTEEVAEVRWLPLAAALSLLSYPLEREFLSRVLGMSK